MSRASFGDGVLVQLLWTPVAYMGWLLCLDWVSSFGSITITGALYFAWVYVMFAPILYFGVIRPALCDRRQAGAAAAAAHKELTKGGAPCAGSN